MAEKRWTRYEMVRMDRDEWRMLNLLFEARAWNMLGLPGTDHAIWRDPTTLDLVVRYEPVVTDRG